MLNHRKIKNDLFHRSRFLHACVTMQVSYNYKTGESERQHPSSSSSVYLSICLYGWKAGRLELGVFLVLQRRHVQVPPAPPAHPTNQPGLRTVHRRGSQGYEPAKEHQKPRVV